MLKAAAIEDRFLNACNETEPEMFGNLSDLAEEGQVEYQFVVFSRPQVFEKLVDNEENTLIRVNLRKSRHHLLERSLVIDNFVGRRECICHAVLFQEHLKLLGDDVAQ